MMNTEAIRSPQWLSLKDAAHGSAGASSSWRAAARIASARAGDDDMAWGGCEGEGWLGLIICLGWVERGDRGWVLCASNFCCCRCLCRGRRGRWSWRDRNTFLASSLCTRRINAESKNRTRRVKESQLPSHTRITHQPDRRDLKRDRRGRHLSQKRTRPVVMGATLPPSSEPISQSHSTSGHHELLAPLLHLLAVAILSRRGEDDTVRILG